MEDRLNACPLHRQPSPARIAGTGISIAAGSLTDEINVGMVPIGRPVTLNIIEKSRPLGRQMMNFEIS
jgi:hypothetical protein